MKVRFTIAAQQEFDDAVDFYCAERLELGLEFFDEVRQTIGRIIEHPDAWPLIAPLTRRCLTHRFPYSVIYQVRREELVILAVMHMHRSPKVWRSRLPEQEP